jgi:hypothetical protein
MFLEESGTKDYVGLTSFVGLSYIMVPFQAYAAVKGFLEKKEGPWFRTPKTGRITDVFKRSEFYKFVQGFMPGSNGVHQDSAAEYLALATANNRFNKFNIRSSRGLRWKGRSFLAILLIISNLVLSLAPSVPYFIKPTEVHAQSFDTINKDKAVTVPVDNFQNGVLVLNTDKSSYTPGQTAFLQIGVLDKNGDTLCNADITLNVYSPDGKINKYSVMDQTIKKSITCRADNNVTDNPDYFLNYKVGGMGTYKYELINNQNGNKINGSFEVKNSLPISIERVSATRINPSKSEYGMTIKVTANENYKGEITEKIPSDFSITKHTDSAIRLSNSSQELVWNVDLNEGQTKTYKYTYKAPQRSPDIFTVGPLSTANQNLGSWQIASDACSTNKAAGNWTTSADWTCGRTPLSSDTITILAGHMMTIPSGTSAVATSITISANNTATQNGLIFADNTVSLALTGVVSMAAGTGSTGGSLFALDAGTLTGATTLALPGSATAGLNTIFRISTGTANFSGTITLSGTAAQSQFTFTGNGTLNVGGNFTTGGTLAGGTGTINFNGGVAQTYGAYITYYNIDVHNTSGGVSVQTSNTTVTITHNLTVSSGTFNIPRVTFTVNGTTSVYGKIDFITLATNTKIFTGRVTIYSGGQWANSISSAVTFRGGITVSSGAVSFNNGTAGTTFDTNSQSLEGAVSAAFGTTTIASGVILTNNITDVSAPTVTFATLTLSLPSVANGMNLKDGTITNVTGATTFSTNTTGNDQIVTLYGNAVFSPKTNLTMTGYATGTGSNKIVCDAATGSSAQVNVIGTTGIRGSQTAGVTGRNVVDLSACSAGVFSSTGLITITGNATGTSSIAELKVGNNGTITAGNGITTATNAGTALISTGSSSTINLTNALTLAGQGSLANINSGTNLKTGISGAASIASAMNWAGSLELYANATSIAAPVVTITGTTTVDAGATFTLSSATGAKTFSGDVTVNGIWNETAAAIPTFGGNLINNATTWTTLAGVHTFSGTGKTISGTQITSTPNITVTGTVTNTSTVTCSTALIGAGTFTNGDGSTGTLNYGGVGGASFNVTNFYASATGNTVNYNDTGANTVIRTPTGAGSHYYNLTISTTGRFASLAAAITVDHDLNISSGSLSDAGFQITGNGSGILSIGSGAYLCIGAATASCTTSSANVITFPTNFVNFSLDPASYVVYLSSGAAQAISSAPAYGNLSIIPVLTGAISKTFDGVTTINGDFTINPTRGSAALLTVNMAGNITVDSGHTTTIQGSGTGPATAKLVTTAGNYNLITGKLNIAANGTLDCTGSISTIELTGTTGPLFTGTGNFTTGSSTVLVDGTGTPTFLSGTETFYNLTFNNAGGAWSIGADATVNNTLTVNAGTLAMGTQNVTVGSTAVSGSGDIVVNGATSQSASGTFTVKSSSGGTAHLSGSGTLSVYNLTLGDGSTAITVDNETGDLALDVANTFNITTGATFQASSTAGFNVGGNWTRSGTFTANNGTVTLDGAGGTTQALSGATFFHNLVATTTTSRTLQFAASTNFTITADLTLTGGSCSDPLILRSGSTNTQFNLVDNSGGTTNIDYVDVEDSNASDQPIIAAHGANSGNNSHWSFTAICDLYSASGSATGYSFQRKTWYDGTYYWKSFYTGSQIQFWYSANGTNWVQNTAAVLTTPSNDFSIEADSSNCFIVYSTNDDIRGQVASSYPNTNFGWSGEVTVLDGTGSTDDYSYPVIARDSSGYVWVGARYSGTGIYDVKTIKEITTTNTLPTVSGGDAVYTISDPANSDANVFGTIVARNSNDMYITFVVNNSFMGCIWFNSDTAWEDSLAGSCASGANYDSIGTVSLGLSKSISAVSDSNGDIHVLYINSSGNTVYDEYVWSWESTVILDSASGNTYPSITLDTSNNSLYAFWIRNDGTDDHIYYKNSTNWGAAATDWHSGTNLTNLTSNYSGNGKVFAEWSSGAASPYTINWDIIAVPENLWLFFSLGIAVPVFAGKKRNKNSVKITRQYKQ